jgi:Lon protease (S16) C-terminal proteolytic domain
MVILPAKNEKDLRDIPEEIRKQIKLVLVDSMDQVLENALRRRPRPLRESIASGSGSGGSGSAEEPKLPTSPVGRPFPSDQPPAVVSPAEASH